jgi:D-sedoheptulose 7-phosphate isomerase
MIEEYLRGYCQELKETLDAFPTEKFVELVRLLEDAYQQERQVFLMGNGGSGATASHIACDLNKGVSCGLKKRFRVICLNDSMPTALAYANDLSYEHVFAEPLKNFLRPGDLVIGLSGSGNSPNVLKAIEYANLEGAHTVGVSGFNGGRLAVLARTALVVPVNDMQKAEDAHLIMFHAIMQLLCGRLRQPGFEPETEKVPTGTVPE